MKRLLSRLSLLIHSIRFRLALWFMVILGVVIVAFSIFVYTRQISDLKTAAITRLEYKSQKLNTFLRIASSDYFQNQPLRIPNDPESENAFLQREDFLAFIQADGDFIQGWGPVDSALNPALVTGALQERQVGEDLTDQVFTSFLTDGERTVQYMFVVAPISVDRRLVAFYLLGTPTDPDRQLPRLAFSLSLGMLVTLAAALLGGFWLADRAIRPVSKITAAARSIGDNDLDLRLNLKRRDELGELADTFDGMLARLEAAFNRQRQFTADASHELRTPLTIIDLETSRALSGSRSSKEYERVLSVIHAENQMMIRLVNQLLVLARMDAGQVELHKEQLDLSDVALEAVERMAPIATQAGVHLSTGELPELPVLGDRQYLVQLVSNLVENAIKYSCGDDGRVEVSTGSRFAPDSSLAWVTVRDNGCGIAPEHLPFLFDRFYQVDAARTRGAASGDAPPDTPIAAGAGLGLSICQSIAHAHHGQIQVESQLGQGSTFIASFPMLKSDN